MAGLYCPSETSVTNAVFPVTPAGVPVVGTCLPGYGPGVVAPSRTCLYSGAWSTDSGRCDRTCYLQRDSHHRYGLYANLAHWSRAFSQSCTARTAKPTTTPTGPTARSRATTCPDSTALGAGVASLVASARSRVPGSTLPTAPAHVRIGIHTRTCANNTSSVGWLTCMLCRHTHRNLLPGPRLGLHRWLRGMASHRGWSLAQECDLDCLRRDLRRRPVASVQLGRLLERRHQPVPAYVLPKQSPLVRTRLTRSEGRPCMRACLQ